MKIIIAGSRDYNVELAAEWRGLLDIMYDALHQFETDFASVEEVVSGGAKGADACGEEWAKRHKIPIKRFPADWSKGRSAGPIRNREMAAYADALVAVWDGKSPGTANMILEAHRRGLDVFVRIVPAKEAKP